MPGQVLDKDGVESSGGIAVRDRMGIPVSLPIFVKPTHEQLFINPRVSVAAQDLSHWSGGADVP